MHYSHERRKVGTARLCETYRLRWSPLWFDSMGRHYRPGWSGASNGKAGTMDDVMSTLTVGLEVEVTGGAEEAVEVAHDEGLTADDSLHSYHCDCSSCEHDEYRVNIVTAQNDCTVSGEFITRPIRMGDAGSWSDLERLSAVFAWTGAYADPHESTGCHVHVSAALLDTLPTVEDEDSGEGWDGREQLAQFFVPLQNDIAMYARGAVDRVRDYNHPIGTDPRYRPREGWLHLRRRSQTVEFRLWNGTTAAWRWRMYAGISSALVMAVVQQRPPVPNGTPVLEALAGLLDDETLALMERQAATPF